ncbi:MAG: hypothetical protein VXZ96_04150 [Myxococcota bacterium]|nr:hypothetical protein [Myxococcota bacterium]
METVAKKLPLPAISKGLVLRTRLELLTAQLRSEPKPQLVVPAVDEIMAQVEQVWMRRGVPSSPYLWCVQQCRQKHSFLRLPKAGLADPLPLLVALSHSALTKPTRLVLGLRLIVGATISEIATLLGVEESVCRSRIRRGYRALARILPTVLKFNVHQCLNELEGILDLLWGIHQSNIGQRYNRYTLLRSLLNQLLHHKKHGEIYSFLALIDFFQARLTTLALSETFQDENRLRWNLTFVKTGNQYLHSAYELKHVGPFMLRAQIVHEQVCAPTWEDIHWLMIADLYRKLELYSERDLLDYRDLNWGEALARNAEVSGGLLWLEQVRERIGENYALSYAKARLLCRMGKMKEAITVFQAALAQAPKQNKAAMLAQIAICAAEP